jgi:hypothetical protein
MPHVVGPDFVSKPNYNQRAIGIFKQFLNLSLLKPDLYMVELFQAD